MNCPSCNSRVESQTAFCVRCGFSLKEGAARLAALRSNLTWILRRSLSGFSSGLIGWVIIPAASRAFSTSVGPAGHLLITGLLGGIFLGTVEGMIEESVRKTVRGGLAGALGGLLGAFAAVLIIRHQADPASVGLTAVCVSWAITGGFIGLLSAIMEPKKLRWLLGLTFGILGGALGGFLGYQMYASLMDMLRPEMWGLRRVAEGITGAILGACLWFIIGIAEKVFILRRQIVKDVSYKECDACHTFNVLSAWYCSGCGAVLQVSAPPEKLNLPEKQALARFISACRYLARLAGTTSVVVAGLACILLGSINVFLGLFGLLAAALVGYILYILFHTLAELLTPVL